MTDVKNAERIRFGGKATPDGFLFELTGGDPALDLANTVVDRAANEPRELLHGYADLVNWAVQAGIVEGDESKVLVQAARRRPAAAAGAFRRAIHLREAIFAAFGQRGPSEEDLRTLQVLATEALRHRNLVVREERVQWEWESGNLDGILWRVADAAVALLTSDRRARVRVCAGHPCQWLFVDDSRRGNRRWCDMTVCGNRAKARRHYAKVRSHGAE